MSTERVLVLDPGDRVGWARAVIEDGVILSGSLVQGVTPLKDFAVKLGVVFDDYETVAYEHFHLRPDKAKSLIGNDFQVVQFIGIVRYLSWIHPKVQIRQISPNMKGTGRKVMPDWMRSRIPLSTEEHDKDALDLLAYYWWDKYV